MINRVGINTQQILENSTQQKKTKVEKEEKLSRVDEIKQQIQNGTYKIDINKTAEALAKTLL